MKRILYISGIFTIFLSVLLLTGWAETDDTVNKSLRQGNRQYESADYEEALRAYETGLAASQKNEALNYNAAQAAYILGEYEKAIHYYEKSPDSTVKFLNAGNICFKAGDAAQDMNQMAQYYSQAMQIYMNGIIKYPQDIPLKYNYELVKEKLEELLQDMEQEDNEQGEDGGQETQEQENTENAQGDQGQESENTETSQENQEQDSEQDESTEEEQSQEGDGEQQGSYSQNEGEEPPDQETIERILQMLDAQEVESLKNNQEVVGRNEDKNGW